ncbi:MAG: class I SAM-dependent methyltransferase [Nannocystis sp.]|nr:class I SAM-dependent methyltransferase [Nannocystis sp.]
MPLLGLLSPRIASGVGVDASAGMIARARRRAAGRSNLSFAAIDGPRLPLPDQSVDVVISLLSFRYLDWDPIVREFARVLRRAGGCWWSTWSPRRSACANCRGCCGTRAASWRGGCATGDITASWRAWSATAAGRTCCATTRSGRSTSCAGTSRAGSRAAVWGP